MKTKRWFSAILIIGTLLWLLAVGSFAVLAENSAANPFAALVQDSIDNGTVPPVNPFTKTVGFSTSDADFAYSGELVTYTIEFQNIITNYTAKIGVTDTLPALLTVTPNSLVATTGTVGLADGVITWIVDVVTGTQLYALTYTGQTPIVTAEMTLSNTAMLYEIKNAHDPITPTTKTLSATVEVKVRPWGQHLPIVKRAPPTPTPTPKPTLPSFVNYNFEMGNGQGWKESPAKLIYSTGENFLENTQGVYYAWLGGLANQTNELSQSITLTLPTGYTDIRIRYRYWIFSDEIDCDNDKVEVQVNAVAQTIVTEESKGNQLCQTGRTFGWKSAKTANLAQSFGGQNIALLFKTQLNASKNSNFFVDVVEFCSDDADAPASTSPCTFQSVTAQNETGSAADQAGAAAKPIDIGTAVVPLAPGGEDGGGQ